MKVKSFKSKPNVYIALKFKSKERICKFCSNQTVSNQNYIEIEDTTVYISDVYEINT